MKQLSPFLLWSTDLANPHPCIKEKEFSDTVYLICTAGVYQDTYQYTQDQQTISWTGHREVKEDKNVIHLYPYSETLKSKVLMEREKQEATRMAEKIEQLGS